jgi:hypothetical protein
VGLLDRIRASQVQAEGTDAVAVESAGEADVETQPAKPRQEWGKPGRCPECSGRGYLDHIDLIDRIMYQHCTECRHEWTVTEAELVSQ